MSNNKSIRNFLLMAKELVISYQKNNNLSTLITIIFKIVFVNLKLNLT